MIEFLKEAALNEHIPRDLYQAYQKISNTYDSTEHETSNHSRVSASNRRDTPHKYGNATYRVITVDEALALIAQNPHNVENIRGIKDGELVEYEYQSASHKYYNIYGNANKSVTYTKPNGEEVTKRNIRYITNPKIWLPLMDKIYWTDEYEHPVSPEEQEARIQKSKLSTVGRYSAGDTPEHNPHRPKDTYTKNILALTPRVADTGRHIDTKTSSDNVFTPNGYASLTGGVDDEEYLRLSGPLGSTYSDYITARRVATQKFEEWNKFKRAIAIASRQLQDIDDDDEDLKDQLEQKIARWKAQEDIARHQYDAAARTLSRFKSELSKHVTSAGTEYVQKLSTVIKKLDEALRKCTVLKDKIDKLKSSAVDKLNRDDLGLHYASDEAQIPVRINTLNSNLSQLIGELQQLKKDGDQIGSAIKESDIEAKGAAIIAHQSELEDLKARAFDLYVNRYKELNAEMDEIEATVNALKPTLAAKKAAKKLAAGQATLDPQIAGIIQFEDDPEPEEVN